MSLRPTATQALARGAYLGLLVGAGGSLVLFVVSIAAEVAASGWLAWSGLLMIGGALGAGLGLAFGREEGADIDDVGIRLVPEASPAYVAWPHVSDLRTERHGGRIHIALYLDDTRSVRLRAPYDGRFLAADPEFERKLFMLRHLWETHRYAAR